VGVVSSVLPYCDAILVDTEIKTLLELGPVRERLGFDTKVFSMSSMSDLLQHLEDVETEAPQEVIRTALELYGEPEPYVALFEGREGQ
jgi:hypothetical protein